MAYPAAAPSNVNAVNTISAANIPCPALPNTHTHLRRGIDCTQDAMNICGSNAPLSRIGTKTPANTAGAPSDVKSQDNISLGSINPSAILVIDRLATRRNAFGASAFCAPCDRSSASPSAPESFSNAALANPSCILSLPVILSVASIS